MQRLSQRSGQSTGRALDARVQCAHTVLRNGGSGRVRADDKDREDVAFDERARGIASIEILLRILRKASDCFQGDDLETVSSF